jgi:hypothetical protein
LAKWIAAVLIVSLMIPAATKQWSDNQQQHQLKADVVAQLAGAVAQATTDGGFLLGAEPVVPYQEVISGWKAEAAAIDAQLAGYFARGADPDRDGLVKAMRAYSRMVQAYIGYCEFYEGGRERDRYLDAFAAQLEILRDQTAGLPESEPVPEIVVLSHTGETATEGWSPTALWREGAQNAWSQNIVNASAPIIRMINDRQPRGYRVGAGEFLRQILHPFG